MTEQLSFWEFESLQSLKPTEIKRDGDRLKVSFIIVNEKGVKLKVSFIFEGSVKKPSIEKAILRVPEGERAFQSESSSEEYSWIDKKTFDKLRKIAYSVAKKHFSPQPKNTKLDDQLNLFEEDQ
ncbi:MAG: hypothetical protein NZ822_02940 [Patescibacteria group bacterium]|nr:hypothetical protein [Patescibacteria group bacterium]